MLGSDALVTIKNEAVVEEDVPNEILSASGGHSPGLVDIAVVVAEYGVHRFADVDEKPLHKSDGDALVVPVDDLRNDGVPHPIVVATVLYGLLSVATCDCFEDTAQVLVEEPVRLQDTRNKTVGSLKSESIDR